MFIFLENKQKKEGFFQECDGGEEKGFVCMCVCECACAHWILKGELEGGEEWHLERDFERGGKKNKRKVGGILDMESRPAATFLCTLFRSPTLFRSHIKLSTFN